jgi:tripartite-type tricarboxylate transporter receptor subunit TctC
VQWYGIMGPAKMQPEVVKRIHEELQKVITSPEFKQRLSAEAVEPMPMSSEQFATYVAADLARYQRVVKERKIELGAEN